MSFIGCRKRRESMAKPLDQLSDPEFKIAYDNFKKTEAQAEKEETANPTSAVVCLSRFFQGNLSRGSGADVEQALCFRS
jgi:hypothetical protein